MLRRRLVAVNIIIITLILVTVAYSSVSALRQLLYRENTLSYNNLILEDCNALQDIFNSSEDKLLSICANTSLQASLKKSEYNPEEIDSQVSYLKMALDIDNIIVLPVKGNDVYHLSRLDNRYYPVEDELQNYDQSYGYSWSYKPSGADVLRVTRPMFSLDNITQIIAIISIDYALAPVSDLVYSFGSSGELSGSMYFLDENNRYILPYHLSGEMELREDVSEFISDNDLLPANDTYTLVRQFRNNGWKLVATVEGSSLYRDSSQRITIILTSAAVLEVAGILLTVIMTNTITEPIVSLSRQMDTEGKDDNYHKIEVPENVTQEIKNLYDSYNNLVDEVNNSIANIQAFSRKEVENQFMLLQAQINPHFLYNTLNAISWMAANHQDEDIQKVVVDLVGLFRTSLNNGKPTVKLSEEMNHVRYYLEIMQYRFPDSYTVEFHVDPDTENLIVTKQILQPLAENALNHGFLESNTQGVIRIYSYIEGDYVVLKMANTGSEIDLDKVKRLLNNDEELITRHYGIRNVNERLTMYYGQECGLNYYIENGETVVEMRLPLAKTRQEAII